MASLQLSNSTNAAEAIIQRRHFWQVQTRTRLNDPTGWRTVFRLDPKNITLPVAPTVGRAVLLWRSGKIKWEPSTAFLRYEPKAIAELLGQWVRIRSLSEADNPLPIFLGRISDVNHDRHGGTGQRAAIDQECLALSLEDHLDRIPIRGTWCSNTNSGSAFRIDVELMANRRMRSGFDVRGNRSTVKFPHPDRPDGPKAYVFCEKPSAPGGSPPTWTKKDLLEYLLVFHLPAEVAAAFGGLTGQLDALSEVRPSTVDFRQMTLWQAINMIVDRRRGVGCVIDAFTEKPTLRVFTVFTQDFKYGDVTIAANRNRIAINTGSMGHVPAASLVQVDECSKVGTIIVRGEPLLSCFTVSFRDENLAPGWKASEETAFWAGPGGDVASVIHERWRNQGRFDPLFRRFIIPDSFNHKPQNGEGGAQSNANPVFDTLAQISINDGDQSPIRSWGRRLSDTLPIVDERQLQPTTNEFQGLPYMDMQVYVRSKLGFKRGWIRLQDGEAGFAPPVSAQVLSDAFGFELICYPTLFSLNASSVSDTNRVMGEEAKFDYTDLLATVATRTDARPQIKVVLDKNDSRELLIDVPGAESWLVCAGTVLGLQATAGLEPNLIRQESSELVQDCSPQLQEVAAVAAAWYGQPRATLRCILNRIAYYLPGAVVTRSQDSGMDAVINTPITLLSIDCVNQTTELTTGWSELDILAGQSRSDYGGLI